MLLVKKIIAYETTCVITVPIFWNINTQAMSRLVSVCESYKVLRRTPHSWSCTWFDPAPKTPGDSQASTCGPCFHCLPWVPEHHSVSSGCETGPSLPLSQSCMNTKLFSAAATASLLMLGGGVGGHRQGIALLCYLANNSKSFCSLKSPFSQQGFPPLFFSSLSYRCCKVFFSFPQQFPTSGPVLSLYIFWVEVNIKGECRETG